MDVDSNLAFQLHFNQTSALCSQSFVNPNYAMDLLADDIFHVKTKLLNKVEKRGRNGNTE